MAAEQWITSEVRAKAPKPWNNAAEAWGACSAGGVVGAERFLAACVHTALIDHTFGPRNALRAFARVATSVVDGKAGARVLAGPAEFERALRAMATMKYGTADDNIWGVLRHRAAFPRSRRESRPPPPKQPAPKRGRASGPIGRLSPPPPPPGSPAPPPPPAITPRLPPPPSSPGPDTDDEEKAQAGAQGDAPAKPRTGSDGPMHRPASSSVDMAMAFGSVKKYHGGRGRGRGHHAGRGSKHHISASHTPRHARVGSVEVGWTDGLDDRHSELIGNDLAVSEHALGVNPMQHRAPTPTAEETAVIGSNGGNGVDADLGAGSGVCSGATVAAVVAAPAAAAAAVEEEVVVVVAATADGGRGDSAATGPVAHAATANPVQKGATQAEEVEAKTGAPAMEKVQNEKASPAGETSPATAGNAAAGAVAEDAATAAPAAADTAADMPTNRASRGRSGSNSAHRDSIQFETGTGRHWSDAGSADSLAAAHAAVAELGAGGGGAAAIGEGLAATLAKGAATVVAARAKGVAGAMGSAACGTATAVVAGKKPAVAGVGAAESAGSAGSPVSGAGDDHDHSLTLSHMSLTRAVISAAPAGPGRSTHIRRAPSVRKRRASQNGRMRTILADPAPS